MRVSQSYHGLAAVTVCVALLAAGPPARADCSGAPSPCARDFAIQYPEKPTTPPAMQGSTHEITFNHNGGKTLWMTAPNYGEGVSVGMDATFKFHKMPDGAMPHGIAFDKAGQLWVSFEHVAGHMTGPGGHGAPSGDSSGQIARLDPVSGKVLKRYNVNTDPHGLGIGPDGKTVWFTGKTKGTVGYLKPDGTAVNFALPNQNSDGPEKDKPYPIYIAAGSDGNMWFTELQGNRIGRVTPAGKISEFPIPTPNSRPIAIIKEPSGTALWFSEEAGNKVARIDMKGTITEFAVPVRKMSPQPNYMLAGLAFDAEGNVWTQQYVAQTDGNPPGPDYIVMIGKSIRSAKPSDKLDFTYYEVPTRNTVMHRIIQGPDMNMWYTELKADKIGRIDRKPRQSKM